MDGLDSKIFAKIKESLDDSSIVIGADTPLIGEGSSVDSMALVTLCIGLEDLAVEMGFDFDWTSDVAMSKSRSVFRTAGSLAAEFTRQMGVKA